MIALTDTEREKLFGETIRCSLGSILDFKPQYDYHFDRCLKARTSKERIMHANVMGALAEVIQTESKVLSELYDIFPGTKYYNKLNSQGGTA